MSDVGLNSSSPLTQIVAELQPVLKYVPDAVMVTDAQGHVHAINDRFTELYGWQSHEVVGRNAPVAPRYGVGPFVESWKGSSYGEKVDSFKTLYLHRDGTEMHVSVTVSEVYGDDGEVVAFISVSRPVTPVRAVDSIWNSDADCHTLSERCQSLFDHSPDAVFEVDLLGNVIRTNIAAEELTGYSEGELVGLNLLSLVVRAYGQSTVKEYFRKTAAGVQQTFQISFTNKSGKTIHTLVKTIPVMEQNQVLGVYVIAKDITARKKAEWRREGYSRILELIVSGQEIQEIFNQIVAAVEDHSDSICSMMLLDENGRLQFVAGDKLPREYVRAIDGVQIGENVGSCGTAAYQNKLVVVSDIEADERWEDYREVALEHGLRACWSIPIVASTGKVLGTFAIYENQIASPDMEDISLLQTYARLASLAMERIRREAEIRHYAYHDTLTGLPNRRLFTDQLSTAIERAREGEHMVGVLFLDIDRFQRINDSLGHGGGDEALISFVERVSSCMETNDMVARLGGDEFTILLPQVLTSYQAIKVAEQILERMSDAFSINDHQIRLTCSIGIALYPRDGVDADGLLKNAAAAMHASKNDGLNGYKVHQSSMDLNAYRRLQLEHELVEAIRQEKLFFHYQPQVHIESGKVKAAEALVRWEHPVLGMIPPSEFIPIAEDTGLIVTLGTFVLKSVCCQMKSWESRGIDIIPISINVSPIQFQQDSFVQDLSDILDEFDVNPEHIILEVTESTLMRNEREVANKLAGLRTIGVKISIDDFGTGFANLSFIKNFPIDILKIDRSFVQDVHRNMNSAAIVSALITLGRVGDMTVVAEGVEAAEQLEFLRDQSCHLLQGYLFSKPISAHEFETTYLSGENAKLLS